MLHYFYLLNRAWMLDTLRPALAAGWRSRSFAPCLPLCRELAAARPVPDDSILRSVLSGVPYDKALWHALVGECLVHGADDMPRVPCMIETLCCWLAPERLAGQRADRTAFTPIEQVYFGTRDLRFGGGWHRPEHVGWNDADDVVRLAATLHAIEPASWTAAALAPLPDLADDADRAEELAYVRDWWPALVGMYEQAQVSRQIIVCERP